MVSAFATSLLITFASRALAAALQAAVTGVEGVVPSGLVTLGASSTPPPDASAKAAALGPGPQYVTITITNQRTGAISTSHAKDPAGTFHIYHLLYRGPVIFVNIY